MSEAKSHKFFTFFYVGPSLLAHTAFLACLRMEKESRKKEDTIIKPDGESTLRSLLFTGASKVPTSSV